MRLLLTISGILEVLVGVLISPALGVALLVGAPTDTTAAVLARLFSE